MKLKTTLTALLLSAVLTLTASGAAAPSPSPEPLIEEEETVLPMEETEALPGAHPIADGAREIIETDEGDEAGDMEEDFS